MSKNYERGIELFNRHEFFECHEVLEEAWFEETGPRKRFYQGIIQIAVAFYHFENANYVGALKLLHRGVEKLQPYAPAYGGLDLQALLADLERWRQKLQAHIAAHGQPPELSIPTLDLRRDRAQE